MATKNTNTSFTPVYATREKIDNHVNSPGYFYISTDTQEAFFDISNNQRLNLKDIVIVSSTNDLPVSSIVDRFYFDSSTNTLWFYEKNGVPVKLNNNGQEISLEFYNKIENVVNEFESISGNITTAGNTFNTGNNLVKLENGKILSSLIPTDVYSGINTNKENITNLISTFNDSLDLKLSEDVFNSFKSTEFAELTGKVDTIETGAEVNVIESITINGNTGGVGIYDKRVDLTIPTKVSDLDNDSVFITANDDILGNAATASTAEKLTTPRKIELTGAVVGSVQFDGSQNVVINAALGDSITIDASKIDGLTVDFNDLLNIPSGQIVNKIDSISLNGNLISIDNNKNVELSSALEDYVLRSELGGFSEENFTTTLKNKLDGIEAGAEVNSIESISLNGTNITIDSNKNININVNSIKSLLFKVPSFEDTDLLHFKIEFSKDDTFTGQLKSFDSRTANILNGIKLFTGVALTNFPSTGISNIYVGDQIDLNIGAFLTDEECLEYPIFRFQWIIEHSDNTFTNGRFGYGRISGIQQVFDEYDSIYLADKPNLALKSDLNNYVTSTSLSSNYYTKIQIDNKFDDLIPTKVSDLTNDSGFLTINDKISEAQQADVAIDAANAGWADLAGYAEKLQDSRTISLSGAIIGEVEFDGSADVTIGTTINNLNVKFNNETYSVVNNSIDISNLSNTFALKSELFSKSYNDLTNKPTIPTSVAELSDSNNYVLRSELGGFSEENFTTTLKNKLDGIEAGAEVNLIESIKVNGTALSISNKSVNVDLSQYALSSELFSGSYDDLTNKPTIPTSTNQLTNNSGFITVNDKVNAATLADKISTDRTITLTGTITGTAHYDANGNISINTNLGENVTIDASKIDIDLTPYALKTDLNSYALSSSLNNYVLNSTLLTTLSGYATLENGRIPTSLLPSYVDDVIEGNINLSAKTMTDSDGNSVTIESGKIYIDITTNKQYRWGGSSTGFAEISSSLALGTTSSTAFPGDRGLATENKANQNAQDILTINNSLSNKVNKVSGKSLSTNDFTNELNTKLAGIETGAEVNIIESINFNDENVEVSGSLKTAFIKANTINSLLFRIPEIEFGQFANFKIEFTNDPTFNTIVKTINTLNIDSSYIEDGFIIGIKAFNGNTLDNFAHNSNSPGLGYIYASENIDLNIKEIFGDSSYFDCPYFRFQWIIINDENDTDPVYGRYGYGNIGGAQQIFDIDAEETLYLTDKPNIALKSELFSGSYNDLTNKPTIPTTTSQLTNNSGFLTYNDKISEAGYADAAGEAGKLENSRIISLSGAVIGSIDFDGSDDVTINTVLGSGFTIDASKIDGLTVDFNDLLNIPSGQIVNKIDSIKFNGTSFTIDSNKVVDISSITNTVALKSELFSKSYNDLTNKPTIPTKVSQLTDANDYVLSSDIKSVAKTGSYNDLTNKPTIPTSTSQLTNNSGFLTTSDLTTYALKSELPTSTSQLTNNSGFITISDKVNAALLADKATQLANSRKITLSGSIEGEVTFDGSQNVVMNTNLGSGFTIDASKVDIDLTPYALKSELFNGSYNSLSNKPTIPSATSDLTNDSGFLTATDSISYAENAGEAVTASRLENAKTISLSGAVSGLVSFDGSQNVVMNTSLNIEPNKIIPITSSNSSTNNYRITWSGDIVTVTHNLGGVVIGSLLDEYGEEILVGLNFIDANNISINLENFNVTNYTLILSRGVINNSSGLNSEYSEYVVESISNLTINPEMNRVYTYTVNSNDTFTFVTPSSGNIISFRLYLTMPSNIVSFTLPSNIIWENIPDFTTANALYMIVFEWNPILNKWLGNLMWSPVELGE